MLDVRKRRFPVKLLLGTNLFPEENEEVPAADADQTSNDNGPFVRLPLYMKVATATDLEAASSADWQAPHVQRVCEKTCYTVVPVPGYAELMRRSVEGAISTENVRRLVAGKGERFLSQYPSVQEKTYALRVETVTRDLFARLEKETNAYTNPMRRSILDATSVTDMIRMLFGEFIWRTNQESSKAEGMHMTTIRITKRVTDLSLFTRTFGTNAIFTEEEMRFIAYACAVLAYASGFYIYNYEERRLDRHQTPPEDIILEIAWVY